MARVRYYTTIADTARAKELARKAGFKNPEAIDRDHPTSRTTPIWLRFLSEAKRLIDEEKSRAKETGEVK